MLTPTLKQPSDLFNKLRREQHRAFHAQHPTHVADHLYNFCVTTLALRDHVFQALELDNKAQAGFHQLWNASPVRVACREIANTAKHKVLDKDPKTKAAVQTYSSVAAIYQAADGSLATQIERRPTIMVLLSDSTTVDVFELTRDVLDFWLDYLPAHSLPIEAQSEAEFLGTQP